MLKYILKRLLYIIPTFIIITFVVFLVLSLSGDPSQAILGPTATAEQVAAKRVELGLDKNIFVRYFEYMGDALQGDFGKSWFNTDQDVFDEFVTRFPRTLQLASYSIFLTILIGIPLGILVAVKQYSMTDRVTTIATMFFISVPNFFLAVMAQVLFALKLEILPAAGIGSFKHFIMPAAILGASHIATQVRMSRSSMLDVIGQDYIRTARAKGADKPRIIFYHALRNALLPVITSIGNAIAGLIGGSTIIEQVFSIPGVGAMMVNAVQIKDVPMVMGPTIFISLIVCIISMLVDVAYAIVDPRIRLQITGR